MGRLPHDVREVGTLLAAADAPCSADQLAQALDAPVEQVCDALDTLVRLGLAQPFGTDEHTIPDVSPRASFRRLCTKEQWAEHHRRLARLVDDPHRRALHLARAVPLVPADEAAAALRSSARKLSDDGEHHSAALRYRRARRIEPQPTPPFTRPLDDLVAETRSLDLAGHTAEASRLRDETLPELLAAGRAADALRLVTSGLPEAEAYHGDDDLVRRLTAIPPKTLDDDDRRRLLTILCRQQLLDGLVDEADASCAELERLATTDEQRFTAMVMRRWLDSRHRTTPAERVAFLDRSRDLRLDTPSLAERHLLLTIDTYEQGNLDRARRELDALDALRADCTPLRRWQHDLLAATMAADAGRIAESSQLRRRAHRTGLAHGVAEADAARRAAEFLLARLLSPDALDLDARARVAAMTADLLDGADPPRLPIERACRALALAESGDPATAHELATALAAELLHRPMVGASPSLALVAELLEPGQVRDEVSRVFHRRCDDLLLVGAGAASIGPAARYLSALVDSRDEALDRLHHAIGVADRAGTLLWRALTRRDLLRLEPDATAVSDDLRSLVDGTELEPLVRR